MLITYSIKETFIIFEICFLNRLNSCFRICCNNIFLGIRAHVSCYLMCFLTYTYSNMSLTPGLRNTVFRTKVRICRTTLCRKLACQLTYSNRCNAIRSLHNVLLKIPILLFTDLVHYITPHVFMIELVTQSHIHIITIPYRSCIICCHTAKPKVIGT